MYIPTKLPNSANINLDINVLTNDDNAYSVSCLNAQGQITDVTINILETATPPVSDSPITIILPTIKSLNLRNAKVIVNYNNSPLKVQILGALDLTTGATIDGINGEKGVPCVNPSGYQVCQVIGVHEWQSLAEITAYSRISDGASDLTPRTKLEFAGANVSVVDDAVNQKTIVTINP